MLCDIDDFTIAVRVRPRPDNIFLKINASDFLRVGDDRINDLVVIGKNKIPNLSFWLVLPNDVSFFVHFKNLELHVIADHQLVGVFLVKSGCHSGMGEHSPVILGKCSAIQAN